MWRGGSVWLSRWTGRVPLHAHHAIQLTLAPERPVRLRRVGALDWQQTRASLVMPDRPHEFDGCGADLVMVFIEPETTVGRALIARHGQCDIALVDGSDEGAMVLERALELLTLFRAREQDSVLIDGARRIIDLLAGQTPNAAVVDARITRALEWMRERLDGPIALSEAAAIAHLSPSRFRHLFVAQTGISFRAYLLWARVGNAVVRGMTGQSWTVAAQQCGFADSAHLSRTCRRMFGIAPTMLGRE